MRQICDDLEAEHASLDALVAGLVPSSWDLRTPAAGWSVRDQISHLGFFDRSAALAVIDETAFRASVAKLLAGDADPSVAPGRRMAPDVLLAWWRSGRERLLDALRRVDPRARLPWYGPPMSARSFATARLMETWAHGQDIADALGIDREPTARLRNVAHLGVQTRSFSYVVRGREPPDGPVHVVLTAPTGELWEWGDPTARDRVSGPVLDFCLVVTQRRHRSDTALVADGALAAEWLVLAQAFAGPPGPGREPGRPG